MVAPFDTFVTRLLIHCSGSDGSALRAVFDRWGAAPRDGETFLDYLCERGVIDRIGARAVLRAWEGQLDDRDARQLFNPGSINRALARLVPPPELAPEPAVRVLEVRPSGSLFGRYLIKGVLGWGGFGPVYLAVHPTLRVPVALKPVGAGGDPDRPALRDRLRAEARLQAQIVHPNVVRVWDYEDGDEPFLVLEYVNGENLRERLSAGPLDAPAAFTLLVQTGLALRAAWRVGVAHHDVKPANILLTPENGFKLADFGLARCRRKFARPVAAAAPGAGGEVAGSLNYMAPERFENGSDHRSDVYSLGLTVYQALTGRIAVPGTDPDAVMLRHKKGDLDLAPGPGPGPGREVSDLIRRMTAVDPARRFDTHDELIRAAEAAFGMRLDLY
ncbi:serine/threonine-protein kinase [Frigoriglobus tundricola]|uniref:Protein kinase domain-containing protein n=1 Tax=Frigoriglobus tundricola TaxID=2774151 RepID=A0A6M5YWP2_9BACT|nr:serine/threonine-protein kinase [Frigoriglobus tundricola]QJW97816.1 hypothetical protein FTUN_5396 [Frigoriglobus tundricola]